MGGREEEKSMHNKKESTNIWLAKGNQGLEKIGWLLYFTKEFPDNIENQHFLHHCI